MKTLVTLIRGGNEVAIKLFPNYEGATFFCERTTPCHSNSRLLSLPQYEPVRRALVAAGEFGETDRSIGWRLTQFYDDGTVGMVATWSADKPGEFPLWVEGEYEVVD